MEVSSQMGVQSSKKYESEMVVSGFGGLVVSMLASGTQVRGFKPGRFFGWQNPQHAFLWRRSKAVCPLSQLCGMLKNTAITWKLDCLAKFDQPPFAYSGLSRCLAWSASGDKQGDQDGVKSTNGLEGWSAIGAITAGPTNRRRRGGSECGNIKQQTTCRAMKCLVFTLVKTWFIRLTK
jgi:hypothetical protein